MQNYAFRIDFPWYVLAFALIIVLLTALVVVAYQVRRVAILNPAETLSYE